MNLSIPDRWLYDSVEERGALAFLARWSERKFGPHCAYRRAADDQTVESQQRYLLSVYPHAKLTQQKVGSVARLVALFELNLKIGLINELFCLPEELWAWSEYEKAGWPTPEWYSGSDGNFGGMFNIDGPARFSQWEANVPGKGQAVVGFIQAGYMTGYWVAFPGPSGPVEFGDVDESPALGQAIGKLFGHISQLKSNSPSN